MYLEFVGLPGSGKSTLSTEFKKQLCTLPHKALLRDEAIIQCLRRRDDGILQNMLKRLPFRVWRKLIGPQFALSEFVTSSRQHLDFIAFLSAQFSGSSLPELLIESIWHTLIRSFTEIQLISQYIHDSELIIMDEAFCQRCFTLYGYMDKKVSDKTLSCYAKLAPISNHVFWMDTSPRNCIERLKLRYYNQRSPYELNSAELLSSFKLGNQILNRLMNILKDQGKHVYHINGNNDKNACITEIGKIIPLFVSSNI